MNKPAGKKSSGRRGTDQVLKITIDPDAISARTRSPEMDLVTKELSEGREVQLMPKATATAYGRKSARHTLVANTDLLRASKWVTMVTSGTALGLASLAVAPASLVAAVVSAGVGAILG